MHFKRLLIVIIFGGSSIVFVLYQIWHGPEAVATQAKVWAPRLSDETNIANPKKYLEVPYTVQAPYAKWDTYDEESCEEAALLMAHEYLEGNEYSQGIIPQAEARAELRQMIDFQVEQLGYEITTDLFPDQLKIFIESYWPGYTAKFFFDISANEIEKEIRKGNPLIIPVTAKLLGNPWYHYEDYHMLVVIGYQDDQFITNDPGTKRGEDWSYNQNVVLSAIEDSGGEPLILIKK